MTVGADVDVIIAGSGIAGSVLAGVLARSGLAVLVAEKDAGFRDRIRGEGIYHWGLMEARRLGVEGLFDRAEGVHLNALATYEDHELVARNPWAPGGGDELHGTAFTHIRFQQNAWEWAKSQGAMMRRTTKVTAFASEGGAATVTLTHDGADRAIRARLFVAADGKNSRAREWTGGHSDADPESHRFGGVAVSGVRTADRDTNNGAGTTGAWVNWFAQGEQTTRIYLSMDNERLRACGAHRSYGAALAFAAAHMPAGALDHVEQAGPLGFFPNNDSWATQITGDHITLVGDAAGAPDPSWGHGTSLAMRDVRELSDVLLADEDWSAATQEYAARRRTYFDVIHRTDLWATTLVFDTSSDADLLRAGNERAARDDPVLSGFGVLAVNGPDGLTADDDAYAHYFGQPPT